MSRAKQLSFDLKNKSSHGGARKGAGRPRKEDDFVRHLPREQVKARTPVHLTLTLKPGLWSLRSYPRLKAFAHAVRCAAKHGLKIQHFSLLSNHVHIIAEATDNDALSRGMQSLAVSLAYDLNRVMKNFGKREKNPVYQERYPLHVLKTPAEVKNAIRYVLANAAKHKGFAKPYKDYFSSAWYFPNWAQLFGNETDQALARKLRAPPDWIVDWPSFLSMPESWLLNVGWMRARA